MDGVNLLRQSAFCWCLNAFPVDKMYLNLFYLSNKSTPTTSCTLTGEDYDLKVEVSECMKREGDQKILFVFDIMSSVSGEYKTLLDTTPIRMNLYSIRDRY